MKQKTALAQAIEKIDNSTLLEIDKIICIDILQSIKPIERQQIEDAFLDGYCKPDNSLSDSTDYFDNNLTQE
jgi:hypothetical protein